MKMYGDYAGLLKWARLEDAGRQLGISLPNSHRAIDDTLLARQVFLSMVNSNT
jgi:DNA polymerase III epsilon subunit-like protein